MSSSKYRPVGYHPPSGDPHKRTGKRPHKAVPKRSKGEMIAIAVAVLVLATAGIVTAVVYTVAGSHLPLNMSRWDTGR